MDPRTLGISGHRRSLGHWTSASDGSSTLAGPLDVGVQRVIDARWAIGRRRPTGHRRSLGHWTSASNGSSALAGPLDVGVQRVIDARSPDVPQRAMAEWEVDDGTD